MPSPTRLYTDFQFRPGHYGATSATAAQIAPYGTWDWAALVRPTNWASGTDTSSGAATRASASIT